MIRRPAPFACSRTPLSLGCIVTPVVMSTFILSWLGSAVGVNTNLHIQSVGPSTSSMTPDSSPRMVSSFSRLANGICRCG